MEECETDGTDGVERPNEHRAEGIPCVGCGQNQLTGQQSQHCKRVGNHDMEMMGCVCKINMTQL